MRHVPFFQVLAEHADTPASSMWHECQVAVVLLRLLRDWVESPALAVVPEQGLRLLKEHTAKMEDDAARRLLGTMLNTLLHPKHADPTFIVGPFLAYAWLLEERTYFTLAADVLQTLAEIVDPPMGPGDPEIAIAVHRRNGALFHRHRQFDSAEASYNRARVLAEAMKTRSQELDIRVRLASIQETRGNLGQAEADLTTIVHEAERVGFTRVESFARRVRGTVMMRRGRLEDALRELYAAFLIAPDDLEREWLLGDMAGCVSGLGLLDTARVIYRALAKTAHSPVAQSLALVNLLEIAVWDNDQETFRTLWRDLESYDLGRDLQLHALLFAARGAERWGGPEAAMQAYTDLARRAQQSGVHDIEFTATAALEALRARGGQATGSLPTVRTTPQTECQVIAEEIEAACRVRLLTVAQ